MGDLDKIPSAIANSDFVKSISQSLSTAPDEQQLSQWKEADKLKKMYDSPEFNSIPPQQRAQVEKKIFDTHIAPSYTAAGKKAPTFDQWVDFRTSDKFKQNLPKMYDYFEDRTGQLGTQADIGLRTVRSFTNLAENLYIKEVLGLGKFQNPLKPEKREDSVTHFFDRLKAVESKYIDKLSPVNANWSRKLAEGVADQASDWAVFAAVQQVTPGIATGAVSKLGLTEKLAQSKLGQFALKRLIGAADMFMSDVMAGKEPSKVGTAIGGVFGDGSKEIKALLANQMVLMGPKATVALLQNAVPSAEGVETFSKDILTTKLTKANSEIYNRVARDMGYSMYQVVSKEHKYKVLATIYTDMEGVLKNPLASADPALQKFMVEHNLGEQMTPEMMQGFKESAEAQAKAGVKPSTDGLVQEEVAKANKTQELERIVPGAASTGSPEFQSNLPRAEMKLEGNVNQYVYALGHYMQKNPNSPLVRHMIDELSYRLPTLQAEDIKELPKVLQQHIMDLKTTGHTTPDDVRGVFRSTNLFGDPTKWQKELAGEVKVATKRGKDIIEQSKPRAAVQPSRTFNIGRGPSKGQVRVSFPSDDLANLYAYKGRVTKQYSGEAGKDPMRKRLQEVFGKDLYAKSEAYRKQIHSLIKDFPEDKIFMAPEPE